MKTSSTRKCMVCRYWLIMSLLFVVFLHQSVHSQVVCSSPRLQFSSPTLVSGTALAQGSVYKFANVMPGVDCYIQVRRLNAGATLVSMETTGQGYPDAWQPIIKGPGTPYNHRSWIDFRIRFKTTGGLNYGFPCLDVSSIDVDGDNGRIGEFIESDGHYSYEVPAPSLLEVYNLGSGRIRLQGPVTNRPGIDTSALDVRGHFYFNGRDSVDLSLGSYVYNNGHTGAVATERLNCIYFKKITGNYLVLPFSLLSFQAKANGKAADLNWTVSAQYTGDRYVIERSFDARQFVKIGEMAHTGTTGYDNTRYTYEDPRSGHLGKELVYYRVTRYDAANKATVSPIVPVSWAKDAEKNIRVYPNPFISQIHATIPEGAEIRLVDAQGKTMMSRRQVMPGTSAISLDGLEKYPAGLYMVQVVKQGKLTHSDKLIKYQ